MAPHVKVMYENPGLPTATLCRQNGYAPDDASTRRPDVMEPRVEICETPRHIYES
jgi:hypothetical protein